MEQKARNENATYGERKGTETEYELMSKSRTFRLIVWQHTDGDRAWLIVGFFNADKRDRLYKDFVKTLNALVWK